MGISLILGLIAAFLMKKLHKFAFFVIGFVCGVEVGSWLWVILLERFLPDVSSPSIPLK